MTTVKVCLQEWCASNKLLTVKAVFTVKSLQAFASFYSVVIQWYFMYSSFRISISIPFCFLFLFRLFVFFSSSSFFSLPFLPL